MLSSGVKDTDHGANSCQIAAPLGDYSRPFAKARSQLKESGFHSLFYFVLVHLSHLDISFLSFFHFLNSLSLLSLSLFLSTFPLFSLQTHIREYLSESPWMLFETICQFCKTESWRWIPEVEVTPFIQQFIRGTSQGQLLQIQRRARQIRITKTETCLLKWSFSACVFV